MALMAPTKLAIDLKALNITLAMSAPAKVTNYDENEKVITFEIIKGMSLKAPVVSQAADTDPATLVGKQISINVDGQIFSNISTPDVGKASSKKSGTKNHLQVNHF